jgi:hypothetical protein
MAESTGIILPACDAGKIIPLACDAEKIIPLACDADKVPDNKGIPPLPPRPAKGQACSR